MSVSKRQHLSVFELLHIYHYHDLSDRSTGVSEIAGDPELSSILGRPMVKKGNHANCDAVVTCHDILTYHDSTKYININMSS